MNKELSMTRTSEALILAAVLIGIAVLSVFDVIPAQVAQYAPLAVVPFLVSRRRATCAVRAC
jgi:hypothetical protein